MRLYGFRSTLRRLTTYSPLPPSLPCHFVMLAVRSRSPKDFC